MSDKEQHTALTAGLWVYDPALPTNLRVRIFRKNEASISRAVLHNIRLNSAVGGAVSTSGLICGA